MLRRMEGLEAANGYGWPLIIVALLFANLVIGWRRLRAHNRLSPRMVDKEGLRHGGKDTEAGPQVNGVTREAHTLK